MHCETENFNIFVLDENFGKKCLKIYPHGKKYYFSGVVKNKVIKMLNIRKDSFHCNRYEEMDNHLNIAVDSVIIKLQKRENENVEFEKLMHILKLQETRFHRQYNGIENCLGVLIMVALIMLAFILAILFKV